MEGGRPVTLTHRGGAWCPPLSCPSQWYSNLSLLWSELAFSWVLAWRVGILWHSHAGWEPGVSPCLVQVNGTPIFHCYGPNWLLAGYWHGGWASCDTHTPGGEPGVPPLSCSSQWNSNLSLSLAYSWVLAWRVGFLWHSHIGGEPGVPRCLVQWYSSLSLSWSVLAYSWVLAWRVGFLWHSHIGGEPGVPRLSCPSQWYSSLSLLWSVLALSWVLAWRVGVLWHSHIGGEPGVPPCLVQVNGTPIFHCYGPNWLLAGYWLGSCDTHTPGGRLVSPPVLFKSMVLQSFTVMVRIGL